jgi:hypothetical protein
MNEFSLLQVDHRGAFSPLSTTLELLSHCTIHYELSGSTNAVFDAGIAVAVETDSNTHTYVPAKLSLVTLSTRSLHFWLPRS